MSGALPWMTLIHANDRAVTPDPGRDRSTSVTDAPAEARW